MHQKGTYDKNKSIFSNILNKRSKIIRLARNPGEMVLKKLDKRNKY